MSRRRPVPIQDSTIVQREEGSLSRAGISVAKARLFLSGLQLPDVLPELAPAMRGQLIEAIDSHVAADARTGMSEEVVLLRAFERLLRPFYHVDGQPWKLMDQGAATLADHCCKGKINFSVTCREHAQSLAFPAETSVALARLGIVDPSAQINPDALIESGTDDEWIVPNYSSADREREDKDVTNLTFWLDKVGPSFLPNLIDRVPSDDPARLLQLSRGISKAVSRWFYRNGWHPTVYAMAGEVFARVARNLFDAIDSKVGSPRDSTLKPAWLRFAWMACDRDPDVLNHARDRVLAAATDEMGLLRPLLRSAHERGADGAFRKAYDNWQTCLYLVYRLGGLWAGTKALLHAFRALSTPALACDLRYWNDIVRPNDPAPAPWNMVPMSLVSMFHSLAGKELQVDPDLMNFRTEFARFCLDRLKTKKAKATISTTPGETELIEPDASWRECLVHAIGELHINPGGKGHHVLQWVSQNDPDEHVRAVAKQSYAVLRHGPSLPKGLSPRRAVIHAFWWLSQAHLLALDAKVDEHGAQRTREQEVRRTAEPETT